MLNSMGIQGRSMYRLKPIAFFLVYLSLITVFLGIQTTLAKQPNIILILTDDQGYGDVGIHGHPYLKTPHLDSLAKESVRFDNFYVSPSCSPTRAALLTGRHEFLGGVTHTVKPREKLSKESVILPQLLSKAGYKTGFIGKWHLGNDPGYRPQERGFQWCSTNQGGPRIHFDPVMVRNGKRYQGKGYREDLFFKEAEQFIEDAGDQPFFCYLATYSPHAPLDAPEDLKAQFREELGEKKAAYLAMIENIDQNVGRLLAYLEEKKLAENTVVIFMNDNGVTEGLDIYNANMRGSKCTIWEGGSRAMSFWRYGGKWKPKVIGALTAHLDVVPTLCELASASIDPVVSDKFEGKSLTPLLLGKESPWHNERVLYQHVARWTGGLASEHKYVMCAIRKGNHVLLKSQPCGNPLCTSSKSQCRNLDRVKQGGVSANYTVKNAQFHWGVTPVDQWALYDSKKDPENINDLSKQHPELVSSLAADYDRWWDNTYPQMIAAGGDGVEKK